jgi:LmbE family N-acetylglucosaminyl deacetylase
VPYQVITPDRAPEDDPPVERAMVVVAHPDDAEFGAGGLVAKLVAAGVEVVYVVLTAGNRGGEGDRSEVELAAERDREQRAAAGALGVGTIVNLGFDDGTLEPSIEVRKAITRAIRQHRPNLVVTQNPVRNFGPIGGNHPDHLAVGEATLAALYPTARNPMAFPELLAVEGLDKWVVDWVYVFGTDQEDHYEDIDAVMDRKLTALLAHASQLGPEVEGWVRQRCGELAARARERGLGEMRYAEAFKRMYTGQRGRPTPASVEKERDPAQGD